MKKGRFRLTLFMSDISLYYNIFRSFLAIIVSAALPGFPAIDLQIYRVIMLSLLAGAGVESPPVTIKLLHFCFFSLSLTTSHIFLSIIPHLLCVFSLSFLTSVPVLYILPSFLLIYMSRPTPCPPPLLLSMLGLV